MTERIYWLGFSVFSGIGPVKFSRLLSYFGGTEKAWKASLGELRLSGIGEKTAVELVEFRDSFPLADYERKLKEKGVSFITLDDREYPLLLKKIKKPPFVLYYIGDIRLLTGEKMLAVVGTRKITEYGRHVTELFTGDLVQAGFTIVSGLAMGVDAVAHRTVIEEGGRTVAVLGCGVDCCYPMENSSLYLAIIKKGNLIISENPLSMQPTKGSFPSRNRIIAGLSLGVLVTEGATDSGSLITANDAFSFGRKVFAVPGPITSALSKGPYDLIGKGAALVTNTKDILQELGYESNVKAKGIRKNVIKGDNEDEQKILNLLMQENLHFDELVKRSKINSSRIGSILTLMEMKGMIKSFDGGLFELAGES